MRSAPGLPRSSVLPLRRAVVAFLPPYALTGSSSPPLSALADSRRTRPCRGPCCHRLARSLSLCSHAVGFAGGAKPPSARLLLPDNEDVRQYGLCGVVAHAPHRPSAAVIATAAVPGVCRGRLDAPRIHAAAPRAPRSSCGSRRVRTAAAPDRPRCPGRLRAHRGWPSRRAALSSSSCPPSSAAAV